MWLRRDGAASYDVELTGSTRRRASGVLRQPADAWYRNPVEIELRHASRRPTRVIVTPTSPETGFETEVRGDVVEVVVDPECRVARRDG